MKRDKELKQFTKELANYIGSEPNDDFLVDVRDVAMDAFEQGWDARDKEVQEYRDFLITLRDALTGNRYELTAKAIDNFLARQGES